MRARTNVRFQWCEMRFSLLASPRWLRTAALLFGAAFADPDVVAAQTAASGTPSSAQKRALLRNPAAVFWRARAPDTVAFDIETSKGIITVELIRAWAPNGVDRFYNLARAGFFDDSRFFRVVPFYIAQFGLAGEPAVNAVWRNRKIRPDSVRTTNARGTLSFAQYSRTDRTTNVFINLRDSPGLDSAGFAPIGRVLTGMEVADSLHSGYGDLPSLPAPLGNPKRLYGEGNRYLDQEFPKLDRLVAIRLRDSSR